MADLARHSQRKRGETDTPGLSLRRHSLTLAQMPHIRNSDMEESDSLADARKAGSRPCDFSIMKPDR